MNSQIACCCHPPPDTFEIRKKKEHTEKKDGKKRIKRRGQGAHQEQSSLFLTTLYTFFDNVAITIALKHQSFSFVVSKQ